MVASNSPSSKRTILTATLLLMLLISASFGALFVNLVSGNFGLVPAYIPPLTITIQLPKSNGVYTENIIPIAFTIQRAYKGSYTLAGDPEHKKGYYNVYLIEPPESYTYFLDDKLYYFKPSKVSATTDYYQCEWTLHARLTEGTHRLSISATSYSFTDYGCIVDSSTSGYSTVVFTVNTVELRVSVMSPRPAKTYHETMLPLNFTVSEPCSWLGYNLDGQDNVTITGNTTLTRLADGTHTLVVYAEDTAGSTGASLPVTFKVETEAASPTEPQPEPFPTVWVSAAIIASAAVVSFGLVAYFIRHKRRSKA